MRRRWWKLGFIGLALWLFPACGKGTRAPVNDPSDFQVYFARFQTYSATYGHNVPSVQNWLAIGFGPTQDAEIAGFCQTSLMSGRQIVINQPEWEQLTDLSKESLVLHELGHCALNRVHRTGTITGLQAGASDDTTYPISIMNPVFVDGDTYHHLQDYYLQELFSHSP